MTVDAAATVAAACKGADLIVTITSAAEVLVGPLDVAPGAVVLSMGGGLEVSHAVWRGAAARFVDDPDYALVQGDAAAWIAAGTVGRDEFCGSLTGTIPDLAAGQVRLPQEGTLMAIVQGTTALDVALAHAVFQATGGQE